MTRAKRPQRRKSKLTSKQENSASMIIKFFSIILTSLGLATLTLLFKANIMLNIFNLYCIKPEAGDFATNKIFEAIRLYHGANENPINKQKFLELLENEVIWYREPKRIKDKIRYGTQYDCFCLSTQPKSFPGDDINRNYRLNIDGFHRYRNKESIKLIEMERIYAEINNGKISVLITNEPTRLEGEGPGILNTINRYFFIVSFGISVLLIYALNILTKLPESLLHKILDPLLKLTSF